MLDVIILQKYYWNILALVIMVGLVVVLIVILPLTVADVSGVVCVQSNCS